MNHLANPDDELDSRNPVVVTLEGVLSASECRALIERIEAAGPTAAPVTTAGAPRTGRALLFNHHLLHEGAPLKQGLEYVLRSDLMYRRRAAEKQ